MKREETINILYGMRADNLNLDDAYTKDKYDALNMAIEALKLIPDNATNGDVIKALFPDLIMPLSKSSNIIHTRFGDRVQDFDKKWWNTPYKAESKVEDLDNLDSMLEDLWNDYDKEVEE
jgi:hypothetical protein